MVPAALAPEVLADPIGVIVTLIVEHDRGIDRSSITSVVEGVAGGRAKQRRLAQALRDRPALLVDGRSPAPRAVAELLLAVRAAGTHTISAPACAACGKPLRTYQRRGQDWYCAVCGPRREPCTGCGKARPVSFRDRDGRPRCVKCPTGDGGDPVDAVLEVIGRLDPSLPPARVVAAVQAAAPRSGQRHQLAWALQDQPDLLAGAGAQAPAPCVLRLIDALCDLGSPTVVRPACPGCGRVIRLHRRIGQRWLCRNCVAKSRAQPCARCGTIREAATRDEHGRPLCPRCFTVDPANQETCVGCSRRRPVSTRTPGGPLCPTCLPIAMMTCAICGRQRPCFISAATGQPWCTACKQRWVRCSGCGQVRPLRGGTRDAPLCATCTRTDPDFWRTCPGCGQPGRLHTGRGRCARCSLDQRPRELLGDDQGQIRPHLQTLYQALTTTDRPGTAIGWLDKSATLSILRHLNAGERQLTHASLDELPPGKPVEHLRSVLVAIGSLPRRDEHLARLQHWTSAIIAQRTDVEQRQLLHRYALWHVIRRLRGRLGDAYATHEQVIAAQRNIRAALALLDWFNGRRLTLATAGQRDLEAWLTTAQPAHRVDAGNFVRWARRQKLTRLDFAANRWGGPTGTIDTETRWEQARWLLHDDTIDPEDRVAGLLVLLYAQRAAHISRLTTDHLQSTGDEVRIRLGAEPVLLPEPLAGLARHLLANRHGHAAIGDPTTSPWLFPGGRPGQSISPFRLTERLRRLGIRSGRARSTALFALAAELPAALLARMLGIHIAVAVAWQRASAGDWTSYAADVSRRI
jgi:aromatic ring-cleaving dioxygenase